MTWEVPEWLVQCLVCKLEECEVLFCNHLAEVITVDANTRNILHYYRENKKTLATVQLDTIITHHIFLYSQTVRVKYQSDTEIRSSEVQSVTLAYDEQPWIDTSLPWHTSILERFAQEKPQQSSRLHKKHTFPDAHLNEFDIQGPYTFWQMNFNIEAIKHWY